MNVCDNLGDHLVGNVYVKVSGLLKFISNNTLRLWRNHVYLSEWLPPNEILSHITEYQTSIK